MSVISDLIERDKIENAADEAMKSANQSRSRREIAFCREECGLSEEEFSQLADMLKQFGTANIGTINGPKPFLIFQMNDSGAEFIAKGGFRELRMNQSINLDANKIAKRSNTISIIALLIAIASLAFTIYMNIFLKH